MGRRRGSKQQVREEPPIKELKKYWRFMDKVEHRVLEGKAGAKHFISNDESLSKVNEIQLVKPMEYQGLEKR